LPVFCQPNTSAVFLPLSGFLPLYLFISLFDLPIPVCSKSELAGLSESLFDKIRFPLLTMASGLSPCTLRLPSSATVSGSYSLISLRDSFFPLLFLVYPRCFPRVGLSHLCLLKGFLWYIVMTILVFYFFLDFPYSLPFVSPYFAE